MINPVSSAHNAAYSEAASTAPKAPAKPPARAAPQDTVHLSAKATGGGDPDHHGH